MNKKKVYTILITMFVLATFVSVGIANDDLELSRAAYYGDIERVKALLESAADVNAWRSLGSGDHTPLMYAVYMGHFEVSKILIEAGADVNAAHSTDHTVLYHALESYQLRSEVIQLLVDAGVNMDHTPLTWAIKFSRRTAGKKSEVPEVIGILIDAGADVNERDKTGLTVLMETAFRGNNQLLDILLRSGAEINATTKSGRTALTLAVMKKHTETVSFLIEAGADLEIIDESGNTPLMIAENKGFEEIVKLLKEAGAVK
jgi:ankyrin repeat protein